MASDYVDSALVDDLYAGALDFSLWEKAILRIASLIGSPCVGLFAFDPSSGAILRDEGYRIPREDMQAYREWVAQDPRRPLMMPEPVLVPRSETQLMGLKDWQRTPIFNEFLKPVDCAYFICTWLRKTPTRAVALSFQATLDHGPFTAEDGARLQPYLAHVARALEIRDRFDANEIRADTLAAGLNRASFGLIVIDEGGVLLEANDVAQQLMRDDAGVGRNRDGTLRLRGRADGELRHWLAKGCASNGTPDATFHVERPMRPPLSVMLTPIPETTSLWLSSSPRWIVFLFDPALDAAPSLAMIGRVLGISEREAEVASLLAQGVELKEIATRLGISVHTTRGHLKSIFSKTDARSQADLVRRIMRVPSGAG